MNDHNEFLLLKEKSIYMRIFNIVCDIVVYSPYQSILQFIIHIFFTKFHSLITWKGSLCIALNEKKMFLYCIWIICFCWRFLFQGGFEYISDPPDGPMSCHPGQKFHKDTRCDKFYNASAGCQIVFWLQQRLDPTLCKHWILD